MGAPMIKLKKDRNYRRGRTGQRCSTCDFFLYDFKGPDDHRCRLIGDGGRGYRVLPHYLCDNYTNAERMKRLRGW